MGNKCYSNQPVEELQEKQLEDLSFVFKLEKHETLITYTYEKALEKVGNGQFANQFYTNLRQNWIQFPHLELPNNEFSRQLRIIDESLIEFRKNAQDNLQQKKPTSHKIAHDTDNKQFPVKYMVAIEILPEGEDFVQINYRCNFKTKLSVINVDSEIAMKGTKQTILDEIVKGETNEWLKRLKSKLPKGYEFKDRYLQQQVQNKYSEHKTGKHEFFDNHYRIQQFVKGKKPYVCLAINGGGYKGLIPILILQEIERRLRLSNSTIKLRDHIHLFAGTSVGALIVSRLLQEDCTCSDLLDFFKKSGKSILDGSKKQNTYQIEKQLEELFGNQTLKQAATAVNKRIMINTSRIPTNYTQYKSYPRIHTYDSNGTDCQTKIAKIIRESTSAPSVFVPIQRHSNGEFVTDGGVLANNPTQQVLNTLQNEQSEYLDDVVLINIGCGKTNIPKGQTCYEVNSEMQNGEARERARQLLGSRFHDFHPSFDEEIDLQDTRDEVTLKLFSSAEALIKVRSQQINNCCDHIMGLYM